MLKLVDLLNINLSWLGSEAAGLQDILTPPVYTF